MENNEEHNPYLGHISQKARKWISKAYLKAVSELPCSIPGCGHSDTVVAHHIKGNEYPDAMRYHGKIKPPDDMVLPLCFDHHHELHDILGYRKWEEKYGHQWDYVRYTQLNLALLLVKLQKNT